MTKQVLIGTREERLKRIGGSEFATVMDINPYQKRIELVLEKAEVITSTFEGNAATRRGEKLESTVIEMFENATGLEVKERQAEFIRKATPLCLQLRCHVDGITSDNAVFEAKTTDIKAKTWSNGIPEGYKAQLEFNCCLSKKKFAYIAVAFCNGDNIVDFRYYKYEPIMQKNEILEYCQNFTKDVEEYKSIGTVNNGKIIKSKFDDSLIEELNSLNEKISAIKAQAKEFEIKKKAIEDKLKKEIGNNQGLETDLFLITMGNRITSPVLEYKVGRSSLKIEYKEN